MLFVQTSRFQILTYYYLNEVIASTYQALLTSLFTISTLNVKYKDSTIGIPI